MSAPQGDPEIELWAAIVGGLIIAGFVALAVFLICT